MGDVEAQGIGEERGRESTGLRQEGGKGFCRYNHRELNFSPGDSATGLYEGFSTVPRTGFLCLKPLNRK